MDISLNSWWLTGGMGLAGRRTRSAATGAVLLEWLLLSVVVVGSEGFSSILES